MKNSWSAKPYIEWFKDFVLENTPNNSDILVVAKQDLLNFGFHKSSEGTEVPNTSATSDVTIDMAVDDTAYTFDFTGQDNTFTASNIIAFSFDPTNNCYDTNVVVVLEYEIGKI